MSRRSLKHVSRSYNPDERASMGDFHVNDAIEKLNTLQQKTVATMTHYFPTREATLKMLFHDDDIEALKKVRGLVKAAGNTRTYEIGDNISLNIDFAGANVPAIEPEAMRIYPERVGPLRDFTVAVKAEHDKFEELKGVLRWLNRNATPGAVRYFFPQAMKLVPSSPIWRDLQEVPSRYNTPVDYSHWAQVLRDAATTVAATMMLPNDARLRDRKDMWLTFKERGVCLDPTDPNKKHYRTDLINYNI